MKQQPEEQSNKLYVPLELLFIQYLYFISFLTHVSLLTVQLIERHVLGLFSSGLNTHCQSPLLWCRSRFTEPSCIVGLKCFFRDASVCLMYLHDLQKFNIFRANMRFQQIDDIQLPLSPQVITDPLINNYSVFLVSRDVPAVDLWRCGCSSANAQRWHWNLSHKTQFSSRHCSNEPTGAR